jgi:hypothetical protein
MEIRLMIVAWLAISSLDLANARDAVEVRASGSLPEVRQHTPVLLRSPAGRHEVDALPSLMRKASASSFVATLESQESREALTCSDVFNKAMNIVTIYKEKRSAVAGQTPGETLHGGWLFELQRNLKLNSVGGEIVDSFNRVLNNLDFGDGLRHGEIWTVTHAEMFYRCALGVSDMLEVHTIATERRGTHSAHLQLCGGDMVCTGLAHSHDGPVWDRSLWPEGPIAVDDIEFESAWNDTITVDMNAIGTPPHVEDLVFDVPNDTANSSINITEPAVNDSDLSDSDFSLLAQPVEEEEQITYVTSIGNSSEPEVQYQLNSAPYHEIPYCFARSLSTPAKDAFSAAVHHIEVQVPCVKFRPVQTYSDRDACMQIPSILVQSEPGGCWSHVGQISGIALAYKNRSQALNIDRGCAAKGLVVHQLSHALGLIHEIYRPRRDEAINLQMYNSLANLSDSFQIVEDVDMRENLGASAERLDFLSLMMYGAFSFSKNGNMVAKPRDLRVARFMGQRMGLSELDVQALGNMYGCAAQVTPLDPNAKFSSTLKEAASANEEELTKGFEGACEDAPFTTFFKNANTGNDRMTCEDLRYACSHSVYGEGIRTSCPRSCHECVPGMWPTQTRNCLLCEDLMADAWHAE